SPPRWTIRSAARVRSARSASAGRRRWSTNSRTPIRSSGRSSRNCSRTLTARWCWSAIPSRRSTASGGDVHAWLMAKRETASEPLRLDESQRAGRGVNAAVNALFSRDHAFVERGIAHEDVHAAPRVAARALLVDGAPTPSLQVWQLPPTVITNKDGSARVRDKGDAQARIEAACVAQIVEWLQGARDGRVRLREGDGSTRELCARDIAILVNSNREARSM